MKCFLLLLNQSQVLENIEKEFNEHLNSFPTSEMLLKWIHTASRENEIETFWFCGKQKLFFSHLFQSIFYRSLVPRMNNFRLNYAVMIKIDRI
jgi:hypothetical protein